MGEWCRHIKGFPYTIIDLNFTNSQYQLNIKAGIFVFEYELRCESSMEDICHSHLPFSLQLHVAAVA